MDKILQSQKGKIRNYTNRPGWATVCFFFFHGWSTEWLSWSKTDNRILEGVRIFSVLLFHEELGQWLALWCIQVIPRVFITLHSFYKFLSSVLEFTFLVAYCFLKLQLINDRNPPMLLLERGCLTGPVWGIVFIGQQKFRTFKKWQLYSDIVTYHTIIQLTVYNSVVF